MHAGIFRNYRLASDGQFTAKPRFEIHKLGSFTLINSQGSRLKEIYIYISVHEQCKYKEFLHKRGFVVKFARLK